MKWTAAIAVLMAAPLGQPPLRLQDEGVTVGQVDTLNCVGTGIACTRTGARGTLTVAGGGAGGAPTTATYITQTPDATLSAEQALSANATGLMLSTTATGVVSTYAGTSCAYAVKTLDASGAASCTAAPPATSGSVLLLGNGSGGFSNYAGATPCTNQFFTGLSTVGASTCTTATLASAQFAGQGTTTTLLHGNGAGNPSFAAVADADITPAYSGTGACAAGTFASTLNRNAAPTCTSDNWHFLGTATGATTTVGPIVWTAVVRQIQCWYQIAGYNGGLRSAGS
jgi:hypothetical protein